MQADEPAGRVLVIAGSDSGGGAGIQADIKAISAMGGYAATAITAITVQNTLGVSAIHPVPLAIVEGQIRAVLDDIGADVVKTGMLATVEIVELVAAALEAADPALPLVLDPVMIATSGDRLVDDGTEAAIRERLVPLATLVTPNAAEAARLTGLTVEDVQGQLAAAEALVGMGAKAALVKGGHLAGDAVTDVLVSTRGMELMERPRIRTKHTHGTGCTLASAIAARMAGGEPLPEAVRKAGDYLHEAIRRAPGFGAGHGPVDHMWVVRP
ncbi:bifunctional hydroxymethylpyrimidine kinase/phosphomethylpyrimidine kinase [Maricaulis sp.]|uniref:bifunctional hydroxymethylpyrimidine kinase/phosphomethylpyrimidine kinase n=2 Tax=Maricaulis sp. TaxID=1486257 RepID=UPI003298F45C